MPQGKKSSSPLNDLGLLLKYKEAGLSDKWIAAKFGITEEEIKQKWLRVLELNETQRANGYLELTQQFTILCHQYQLLGESMKIVAGALGNFMQPEEINALITSDPAQTFKNLTASAVILRPFKMVDPEQSLQDSIKAKAESN